MLLPAQIQNHLKSSSNIYLRAEDIKVSFIKELWKFLRVRKKLWLLPIVIIMVVLGGLLILAAKSAVVAPFIYTLF